MPPTSDLVVVANRLPVRRTEEADDHQWVLSPGGLVSALTSVVDGRELAWVGWSGIAETEFDSFDVENIHLHPVELSQEEVENYYENFSNRTLWPLYHDAVRPPEYHRHWWYPYVAINRRFAERVAEVLAPGGTVWVHDYHLQLVPGMLRILRPDAKIAFFLHIPFPPRELFAQIPWRKQILEGLLGADLVGFQTPLGAHNFAQVAQRYTSAKTLDEDHLAVLDRAVEVRAIPISVDFDLFEQRAKDPANVTRAKKLRNTMTNTRRILLGVDRLDYTKGIDIRLRAFETLLQNNPELAREVVFIQIAVPSRGWVQEYEDIRVRIEQLVGHINGTYGEPGSVPVHYLYRNLDPETLVSYYMAADVMVVTPLRDGMNLVAKEYVSCRTDDTGVLVLSEFTGAAHDLKQALQVNPHDVDGLAASFDLALRMPESEVARRMHSMREAVRDSDVFQWAEQCLLLKKCYGDS